MTMHMHDFVHTMASAQVICSAFQTDQKVVEFRGCIQTVSSLTLRNRI